ncbi:MAG: RibD family protein [Thermosynechococcaceae cyanobacterium]
MNSGSDGAVMLERPHTTVVLAMSADGKISDKMRSHPRFGSQADFDHLERQVAAADAVLFGAGTLRAGGSAMRVLNPALIQGRVQSGKPEQPIQIVCTRSGEIDPTLRFFGQPIPRYLLTTPTGAKRWEGTTAFDEILAAETGDRNINWHHAFAALHRRNIQQIAVLGGGEVVAALLEVDLIDELHLTICPVLLGSEKAPTPVAGVGFTQDLAPKLELLNVTQVGQELFLHYRVCRVTVP